MENGDVVRELYNLTANIYILNQTYILYLDLYICQLNRICINNVVKYKFIWIKQNNLLIHRNKFVFIYII